MSSRIIEKELVGFITELQQLGRHTDAALLDMAISHAKGQLSELVDIRDCWAVELGEHGSKS